MPDVNATDINAPHLLFELLLTTELIGHNEVPHLIINEFFSFWEAKIVENYTINKAF
jgi:hypothetical protein